MTMRFLRIQDVMSLTGLARSTIYKFMDEDVFLKPFHWEEEQWDG